MSIWTIKKKDKKTIYIYIYVLFILILGEELADFDHWQSEMTLALRLWYISCYLFIQEQESELHRLLSGAEACRRAERHNPGKNWR